MNPLSAWKRLVSGALAALAFAMLAAPASAAPGDYLVLDKNADAAGHLYRVSPDGSTAVEVPTGGKLVDPVALAYGPDRAVYIVDKSIPELGPGGGVPGPGIWRFVPGSDPVLFSGLGHLGGPTAGTGTNFSSPEDIAWNPVRRELDVVDKTFNGVLGVDPATGDRTEVAHGSFTTKPSGIAVAPDGKIYVADPDAPYDGSALTGGVFMYDVPAGPPPATTEVEVAHNGAGVHAPFADPTGIAVMPNGHLVVTDRDTLLGGRLIDVDPTLVATSAASAIAVTSPPPPGDGTSTNPLDKPTGVTVSGSDVVIADPHGPLPCWTSMACTPGDAEGLIARLALTNPTTGTLSFPGGKTAKELNAAFVDPVDVAIVPNTPPVAELTAPAVAFVGEALVLDASSSTDADGDALTVDFDTDGDGIYDTPAGSSLTQSVIYASEGTRNVAVRVIDSHGAAAVMSVPVSVLVRPATGPGPDPQPGPTPGPGPALPPGPGGATPDATSVTTPSSVTLADLLSPNGVVIPLTCSSDCTVTGTLDIAAKDLNSLTAVVRVVRLGNGSVKLKAGAKGKLRMKLTAKARKRLRAALKAAHVSARRKIRLNLTLHSKYRSGKKKTIRRKIILRG